MKIRNANHLANRLPLPIQRSYFSIILAGKTLSSSGRPQARAMANAPAIILADEPTGALDSKTGRMVMDLFHQLNREQGKTIVLITHNQELAAETGRIFTMRDGILYTNGERGAREDGTR